MSWLFSQALVEEYSEGNSLDGVPCAQLNVMPTPHKFWRNDKTMEFSDLSRFGLTLQLLTESRGEELLMLFLADFHAKTFHQQEKVLESKAQEVDYGSNLKGLLAKYDPESCMWKTAQCSLFADLELFLETWPRWGSMRNGECWERPAWGGDCEGERFWLVAEAAESGWTEMVYHKTGISEKKSFRWQTVDAYPRSRIDRIHRLEQVAGEPAILGSNDGMAYRVDRLHGTGNGQHPVVAATAFAVLSERLGI